MVIIIIIIIIIMTVVEEFNDLYSPNSSGKSRRMRWAGHVARIGDRRIQGFGGET